MQPDHATAIVVLTHDDKFDVPMLVGALASEAYYVGALGSRRNQERRRERLLDAARQLRTDGFDYLSFITEVDWQDRFELIYHLFAYDYKTQPMGAILRCDLPRDAMPSIASVTSVWPGAEFMEREAFEMMGIRFLGHPDLRRILLPDDFIGFPMRRDYETDYDYITVKQLVHESD